MKKFRTPGRAVDVAEAHAALVHLERVTAADARKGLTESRSWVRANRSVAEAMSFISARRRSRSVTRSLSVSRCLAWSPSSSARSAETR